ncbi:MAG: M28 family peptidase [Sediminibacterium sp.]|nr:M28 family peptidase [Sediminibacterium sp.]MDP3129384.1 M28 family peptidase [Sediminibacterium sp.]
MKKFLLILVLIPVLSYSQSKRKKRLAEAKANAELLINLKAHIQYLSDDALEGRMTGSKGEELALQYIIAQYKQIGLEPGSDKGYIQEFDINEGKKIDAATLLQVDDKTLVLKEEYIPLAFSANKSVTGNPAIALSEAKQPWFKDLKDLLEENKTSPHFDIEAEIKKIVTAVSAKGATALFLFNTSAITDNVQFNKNDKSPLSNIPVIYLTKEGVQKYFSDNAATLSIVLNVSVSERIIKSKNITAFINNQAANTVILGAHYDHLGYGMADGMKALDTGRVIHNGADDNASGTAALIELARKLKKAAPANNNYLLLHFTGEEMGLLGSKYWTDNPTISIKPNYMINMDMVGRYDTAHKLTVGGYGTSPVWGEIFAGEKTNLALKFDSTGGGPSDHATFYRKEMPVLFLFTGSHSDYHKATDDWDKINYESEKDIVKFVYRIIEATDSKGKLGFTKTKEPPMGRSSGFKVSLGVIPDYGYTGTGMRIDGVSAGKVAAIAGLQAGDILLQLGNYTFVDVSGYMQSLGKFNKGDKTQLRIKRGKEEKVFDIVF